MYYTMSFSGLSQVHGLQCPFPVFSSLCITQCPFPVYSSLCVTQCPFPVFLRSKDCSVLFQSYLVYALHSVLFQSSLVYASHSVLFQSSLCITQCPFPVFLKSMDCSVLFQSSLVYALHSVLFQPSPCPFLSFSVFLVLYTMSFFNPLFALQCPFLSCVCIAQCPDKFSFAGCKFHIQRCKESTGRVVMWRQMNIFNSFTLEATFSGSILDK